MKVKATQSARGWEWVLPTKETFEVFREEAALSYLATLYWCWQDSFFPFPVPYSCCSNLALLPLHPNPHSLRRRPHFLFH